MNSVRTTPSTVPCVCVLGAGVIGLSVATRIMEKYHDRVEVIIVAENIVYNTTSHGCGGTWEPYKLGDTDTALVERWAGLTYDYFLSLCNSKEGSLSGCQTITSFNFHENDSTIPSWTKLAAHVHEMTAEDISALGVPSKYKFGFSFLGIVADQSHYLPWMANRLRAAGVQFQERKVNCLKALAEEGGYDVIINCTGLQSKELLQDKYVYPIRGQVLKLKAPWIKHLYNFEPGNHYLIPNTNCVIAGGTAEKDEWSTNIRETDSIHILSSLCDIVPSLIEAKVEGVWSGLRPGRSEVRLERGVIRLSDGHLLPVIHNYGHGGAGVTLSMGCADDVVQIHLANILDAHNTKHFSRL